MWFDEVDGTPEGAKGDGNGDCGETGGVRIFSIKGDNGEDVEIGDARLQVIEDGSVRQQGFGDLDERETRDGAELVSVERAAFD